MALTGCCCCRLREGCMAIGTTLLILAVLGSFGSFKNWAKVSEAEAAIQSVRASAASGQLDLDSDTTFGRPLDELIAGGERAVRLQKVQLAVNAVETLLSVLFNCLLIHGVRRSAPGFLLAWLVYYALVFAAMVVFGFVVVVYGGIVASNPAAAEYLRGLGLEPSRAVGTGLAIGGVVVLAVAAFFWYLWAVVLAYRRELSGQAAAGKREVVMQEMGPPGYQPGPPAYQPGAAAYTYQPAGPPAYQPPAHGYQPGYQPAAPQAYQPMEKQPY